MAVTDIKRAVKRKVGGHPQIDADLFSKARSEYIADLQRECKELRELISMYELCGTTRLACANGHSWLSKGESLSEICPWCEIIRLKNLVEQWQSQVLEEAMTPRRRDSK